MNTPTLKHHKILGFDFGLKNIGIAYGQALTNIATPLTTIKANNGIPNWNEIKNIIDEWQPNVLIVGIPLNMDGTEQDTTVLARKFAISLKNTFNLPVIEVDERLTTWEAKKELKIPYKDAVSKKEQHKVNAKAAAILIEQWLNY